MRSFGFLAVAALCVIGSAAAQTPNASTAFTATRIQSGGVPVTGTLTIKAVDQNNVPSSLTTADGYFDGPDSNGNLFVVPITAGALPNGFSVPDQATAAFTRAAANNYLVDVYGVPAASIKPSTTPLFEVKIPAGTVTGSTFAFDRYAPVQIAAVLPPGIVAAATVPSSCIPPSVFYPTSPDVNGNYKLGKCVGGTYKFDTNSGGGNGTNGTNGTNGSNFLQATGAPASGTGSNGDSYLDNATGLVYLKSSGVWAQTGSLKGPSGTATLPTDPTFNSITIGGTGAGFQNFVQGAAPGSLPGNTIQETAPTSVTSYRIVKAGAATVDTSGNTVQLFTLSGSTMQARWAAGCTVFACFGQANNFGTQNQSFGNGNLQFGQAGGSSTYSDFTFNGNHADGQRTGCVGATSDTNVYCDVPTGGTWAFRVNSAYIASITGNGVQLKSLSGITCNAANKGMLNYTAYNVGSGTADYLGICAKKADDTYAFRAVTLN